MAISILTESEKKVFYEVYGTTRTKMMQVIKDSGLPEITAQIKAEVEALRKEQAARHKINFWQFLRNTANDVARNIDKLSK